MEWPRSLIFVLPALSLLPVACADLVPLSRYNDDLSLPPSLSPAQFFADHEPTGKGSVLGSIYQRKIPNGVKAVTAHPPDPFALPDATTPFKESRRDSLLPVSYAGRLKTGKVETSKTDRDAVSIAVAFRPGHLLGLKGSYMEQAPIGIEGVLDLDGQKAGLNLRADASLTNGKLNVYGEWDYGAFEPRSGYAFGQDRKRLFIVGLEGNEGWLSYGARHGFAGHDYKTEFDTREKKKVPFKPGKSETAFWARWGFGDLAVKGSVSESWDNLESDPDKPRVTDRWTGAMLEYTFSSRPYVGYSLGYFRGTRRSSREPLGYNRHDEPMERLESTFDYAGGSWNASLYTSYARVGQAQRSSRLPTNTLMHYLSASFYPIESFSITPTLGYYSENYSQFDARTVNRSASLAMFYQPADHNIRYTAFGSYDSERNPTWDIERRSYYLDGGLTWSLGDSSIDRKSLSLGFAYNHYMDAVYSETNSEDLSLWLVFRVGSLASPRLTPQYLFEE